MEAAAILEWTKLGVEVAGWIVGIIARYASGDDGPEVRRVIDVLPAKMRADVEHERQRALLTAELAAQLRGTEPPPSPFDGDDGA